MTSIYGTIRSVLLAIIAIVTLALSLSIIEFGIYFGVAILAGALLSLVYLFFNFDKKIDSSIVTQICIDAFAGLIIFTFPEPNTRFTMIVFSFWIAIMGTINLKAGFSLSASNNLLWLYLLSGISFLILGFIVMNYSTDYLNSIGYLIGITLLIYSLINIYLNKKIKTTDY